MLKLCLQYLGSTYYLYLTKLEFLCRISHIAMWLILHNSWLPSVTGGEAGGVMGPDIFIGFQFCLRGQWTLTGQAGSEWGPSGDRPWLLVTLLLPPSITPHYPAIHIAYCRIVLLDIASWKQNHFPEMSLSGASERARLQKTEATLLRMVF